MNVNEYLQSYQQKYQNMDRYTMNLSNLNFLPPTLGELFNIKNDHHGKMKQINPNKLKTNQGYYFGSNLA